MSVWADIRSKSIGKERRKERSGEYITTETMPVEEMAAKVAEMMKLGIVHFVYEKKDKRTRAGVVKGEVREAWGTKKMDIVDHIPHGGECPPKRVGYTTYFDCEKTGWRVYWDGKLVGFYDEIYTYPEFERLSKL